MALTNQQNDADEKPSGFLQDLRKQSIWRLAPMGYWREEDNSRVIFDGFFAPIIRIRPCGAKEIVPYTEVIRYWFEHHYHTGFGADPDPEVREIAAAVIKTHDLKHELGRRKELQRQGALPRRGESIEVSRPTWGQRVSAEIATEIAAKGGFR